MYDIGKNDEDTVPNIEAYPSQNLDNLFPDGDTHLQFSWDVVDDPNDTQLSYIGEHFELENDNWIIAWYYLMTATFISTYFVSFLLPLFYFLI